MDKLVQKFTEFAAWEKEHLEKKINEHDSYSQDLTDGSSEDESTHEFKLSKTEEYHYDTDEIKNSEKNICIKCGNISRNKNGLAICRNCICTLTINKTAAMKIYNLKANDLDNIDCFQYKNCYGGYTYSYLLKEIRLAAIEKKFGVANPPYDVYHEFVKDLLDDATERETKSKERGAKIIATREKNRELKLHKEKKKLSRRRSKLKKALAEKKISLKTDCDGCEACSEYLDGLRTDLNTVVKSAIKYSKRKSKLESALGKKNLVIRDDSYYCNQYLRGEEFTLEEVVDAMQIMNFFANKTDYFILCKNYLQKQYSDAKEYRYWDGQKIILCEEEKEEIKKEALKKYLHNHTSNKVPNIVIKKYQ